VKVTKWVGAALAGAALLLISAGAEAGNPRIALVIGESAYPDAALPTAANDAGLVAQVLQAAGFDVVGARDLDQKSIRESLRDFIEKANAAGPDMQAFVYFAGRALQYGGDNYLAPIDAHIARDSDVPIEAVRLSDLTHALAAAPGLARVVVIDGARANPYAQQGQPLAGGLALVKPEPNSILAFNAAPGSIGVEDAGDYGVYAKSLAGLMRQGGVDITEVLDETRVQVNQQTQGAQIPWNAGQLSAPYFLFERVADAPAPRRPKLPTRPIKDLSAQDAYQVAIARDRLQDYQEFVRYHRNSEEARRVEAILAARREAMFWQNAWAADNARGYWTYLRFYPDGPHAWDARRRLAALNARREPPPGFAVMGYRDLPPPPQSENVYADRPVYYFGGDNFGPPPPPPPPAYRYYNEDADWRDLPPPPRPTLAGVLPTLAVAIPLMLAARAYHDRPHRNGVAPASAPPPQRRPIGPPPLPRGVHVQAAPVQAAPARAPLPAKGPGQVKFAPPPTAPAKPAPQAIEPQKPKPLDAQPRPIPAEAPKPAPTPGAQAPKPATVKPELVKPEPANPATAKPEPAKPEPPKPAVVKPEPAKPEPTKPAMVKPEPAKPESVKPEPPKPAMAKPEPRKPEPPKPGMVKPEPVKPEPAKPGMVKPEPVKPEPPKPAMVKPEPRKPEPPKPAMAKPEPPKPAMVKPEPVKPEPPKPAMAKPEPRKPEPPKPAMVKPEPRKPEPPKPAMAKPEPRKPEPAKPAACGHPGEKRC